MYNDPSQIPEPTQQYDLLYIDPPRWYNSRKSGGERNDKTKFGGGAMKHYPLMKDTELKELKQTVTELTNPNCIMFMWVTMPRLDFAIELIKHRGFDYKTVGYTWMKTNKDGTPRINPGYYTASNIELCLIATKKGSNKNANTAGIFRPEQAMIQQIIAAPITEHSRKPEQVRANIERMYPTKTKLEMFARTTKPGWAVRGNETDKF